MVEWDFTKNVKQKYGSYIEEIDDSRYDHVVVVAKRMPYATQHNALLKEIITTGPGIITVSFVTRKTDGEHFPKNYYGVLADATVMLSMDDVVYELDDDNPSVDKYRVQEYKTARYITPKFSVDKLAALIMSAERIPYTHIYFTIRKVGWRRR